MEPITAMVAVAVVSGIAQMYQSEKANKANKKRLKEIKRMFEALVPPQYDLSPNDPPDYITQSLQGANLDFSSITPEQFKLVGSYSPEVAQYIAEINPTLIKETATSKEAKSTLMDNLRELKKIAGGENFPLQALFQQAAQQSQQEAQSRMQSTLQDAQRRGTGGSGASLAAILQGNSDSMSQGADASRDSALAAYQAQMDALNASSQLGGSIMNSEMAQQQANADIINAFNQRTSTAYQNYLNNRANTNNNAQLVNLQNAQNVSNQNVAQNNAFAQWNLSNKNALSQQDYANTVAERNYQNQLAESKAQWSAAEKDRQNSLKNQSYQDQLQRANGMAGIGAQQMQMGMQSAADRNNAIAGVAGGITGAISAQQSADVWEKYIEAIKAGNAAKAAAKT